MNWAAAIAERVTRGEVASLAGEPRTKTCTLCGEIGHQRNSAVHRQVPISTGGRAAPPPLTAARGVHRNRSKDRCSACGEPGHRSNSPRHKGGASDVLAVARAVAVPPAAPAPAAALDRDLVTPSIDPSDDDAFVPEVVARARAKHHETATGRVRAKTIAGDHLSRVERRAAELVVYPDDVQRPRTRGECQDMPRPCPFVSCSHHLFLDVNEQSGAIKLNFPDKDVSDMAETCSLDVADRGGTTLEEVGALSNVTRERVRQIEMRAVSRLRLAAPELAEKDGTPDPSRSVEDRLGWL